MAARKKKARKIRTDLRKKHETRTRKRDFTRDFSVDEDGGDKFAKEERLTGKGRLTRKRTVMGDIAGEDERGLPVTIDVDLESCVTGRVLSLHGLSSRVQTDAGKVISCATRGLLKSLSTDQRNAVVAGDRVLIQLLSETEGVIERVEPRHGIISRTSKNRQHVLVANVDLMLIVTSCAEPVVKPNLIDRFLVTAEKSLIQPVICLNKIDLIDAADIQPLVGVFGQLGYPVMTLSATAGIGIEELKALVKNRQSVVAGQSGVGKSSLLNTIEPGFKIRVSEVSLDNQKGRHTTTAARLFPLSEGGFIVDTPGIRQFELWDVIAEEIPALFREFRPFVNLCRFPDCSHTHEENCAIKDAVADGKLDARRYESYCHMILNESPTK